MANLTISDVESIVNDEMKKFINKQLDKEVSSLLNNQSSKTHNVSTDIVKNGIEKLAQFLWMQKATWKNNIK